MDLNAVLSPFLNHWGNNIFSSLLSVTQFVMCGRTYRRRRDARRAAERAERAQEEATTSG
jgi:hypothetical protein